ILLQMARNVVATIVPRENIINLPRSLNLSKATSLELLRAIINDQKSHITIIRRGVFSISSTRELRKLENYLLASLKKPDDGFISYYINRRISARISKFLVKTSLTPNMISIISFAMAAVAAYFFSIRNYLMSIIAGILTQMASIIDGCDGEVARLKGLSSKYGALFDTLLDRYADILLVIGIGYGYYLMTQNSLSLLLLAIPLTGFIMSSYARKEYMIRYEKQPKGKLLLLIRRDFRLFGIFIGALIGMAYHAIITIGALSHIIIIIHYIIGQRRKE
ncbi:MAG: CDP-alcohol phosphatidyltransferase family protein, partial [Candidatus Njordarchaeales archaeon]